MQLITSHSYPILADYDDVFCSFFIHSSFLSYTTLSAIQLKYRFEEIGNFIRPNDFISHVNLTSLIIQLEILWWETCSYDCYGLLTCTCKRIGLVIACFIEALSECDCTALSNLWWNFPPPSLQNEEEQGKITTNKMNFQNTTEMC